MANPGYPGGLSHPDIAAALEAYDRVGTVSGAARELGVPRCTVQHRIHKGLEWRDADPAAKVAADAIGATTVPNLVWTKTHRDGSVTYSVQHKAQKPEDDPDRFVDAIKEGLADAPVSTPGPAPEHDGSDLCAVFPVADLHMGMLADAEETGEDWDGKKALSAFSSTFDRLVTVTPPAGCAVLAQLGDLMHVDDLTNRTPQHKHDLDADTRYFMILRRAVAAMKTAIDRLKERHGHVIYRGCRGNHDQTAHYAVTLGLAEHYRGDERVTIVDSANEFFVHEFGANMLLLHHGDRTSPERVAHMMAAEWPEVWGRTKHRIALSGHVHHMRAREIGGMTFESVGSMIPRDAYAHSLGYTPRRALTSMVLHRHEGEISRNKTGVRS